MIEKDTSTVNLPSEVMSLILAALLRAKHFITCSECALIEIQLAMLAFVMSLPLLRALPFLALAVSCQLGVYSRQNVGLPQCESQTTLSRSINSLIQSTIRYLIEVARWQQVLTRRAGL